MGTKIQPPPIRRQKRLKNIVVSGGSVERELVAIDKLHVVLLRKEHPILKPHFTSQQWTTFAAPLELPEHLSHEVDEWNKNLRFAFNCHTVAIGSFLGMQGSEWLEGARGQHTLMNNPAQDLLDAYFEKVRSTKRVTELAKDTDDNDVVVLRHHNSNELVHSGRIRRHEGESLLLSKFGEHPVAITSLEKVESVYAGQYDCVEVYRWHDAEQTERVEPAEPTSTFPNSRKPHFLANSRRSRSDFA